MKQKLTDIRIDFSNFWRKAKSEDSIEVSIPLLYVGVRNRTHDNHEVISFGVTLLGFGVSIFIQLEELK